MKYDRFGFFATYEFSMIMLMVIGATEIIIEEENSFGNVILLLIR